MKKNMKNKSSNLADKLFPEIVEIDNEILNIPPEKRKLNTETYDFTVSTISDYIKNQHIKIPQFQRGYVWNRSQASRLIESLIIQCPIPVVFLSQNSDETLSVIDGNQRLNSIHLFLKGDFALQGLTAYPELDGYKFSELDPRFQRHINNRTIRCIVILKDTHPQIKFDVFERLNTGSVKLNAQELRHGIHHGSLMKSIEKLSKNKLWIELCGIRSDKRMKREELILRYFALSEDWRNYQKPLSGFLTSFSEKHQKLSDVNIKVLEDNFLRSIELANGLFGKLAFKSFVVGRQNPKFNSALYDAQIISINELNLSDGQVAGIDKNALMRKVEALIISEDFLKSISQATTDRNAVLGRIRAFQGLLNEFI